PMRRGPVGWFIACRGCALEFESKGWAYCPDCMALPAEERRDQPKPSGRNCERPGCDQRLSRHARADALYCSSACRKAARRDKTGPGVADTGPPEMSQLEGSETRIKRALLIGPKDFPIRRKKRTHLVACACGRGSKAGFPNAEAPPLNRPRGRDTRCCLRSLAPARQARCVVAASCKRRHARHTRGRALQAHGRARRRERLAALAQRQQLRFGIEGGRRPAIRRPARIFGALQ